MTSRLRAEPGIDRLGSAFVEGDVHLTARGLAVTPEYSHYAMPCQYQNVGLVVPTAIGKKYARRGGLLAAALEGQWR